jgi:hypothetical protein
MVVNHVLPGASHLVNAGEFGNIGPAAGDD